MSEAYRELHEFIQRRNNLRICILDNNNIQYCMQNKSFFPIDKIYEYYDLVLIPGWVHAEISQSEQRLQYIAEIPKHLIILDEVTDYLPLVRYQDERLMNVFYYASPPTSKPRKYLKGVLSKLKEQRARIANGEDIVIEEDLEEWIDDYYLDGFDIKETPSGELKKNAGEISILTLAYLLVHQYGEKIKQIAVSSSDKGVLEIKKNILDHVNKYNLLNVPPRNPIGFLSTDVLLATAFKLGAINREDLLELRKNKKFVYCTISSTDGVSAVIEDVLETEEFLGIISEEFSYNILF